MDKVIEAAHELKDELEKLPLIIEYKRIKQLVDTSDELNALKKDIAIAKSHGDDELHKKLLDRYNSHPLMVNLRELSEEVSEYLKQISDIVNKK